MSKEKEVLTCTVCEQDFERIKARGRKPKLCDSCKAKEEAKKEYRAKAGITTRVRKKYINKYTIREDLDIEEGGLALYVPYHMFSTHDIAIKYAKELQVEKIDRESGVVHVHYAKEILPTTLDSLHAYEVERVEVVDNEEPYVEEEMDT